MCWMPFFHTFLLSGDKGRARGGRNRMWLMSWKQTVSCIRLPITLSFLIVVFAPPPPNFSRHHKWHKCKHPHRLTHKALSCVKPWLHFFYHYWIFLFYLFFWATSLHIWASERVRCHFSSYCTEQHVCQCHPGRAGVSKSSCLISFEE